MTGTQPYTQAVEPSRTGGARPSGCPLNVIKASRNIMIWTSAPGSVKPSPPRSPVAASAAVSGGRRSDRRPRRCTRPVAAVVVARRRGARRCTRRRRNGDRKPRSFAGRHPGAPRTLRSGRSPRASRRLAIARRRARPRTQWRTRTLARTTPRGPDRPRWRQATRKAATCTRAPRRRRSIRGQRSSGRRRSSGLRCARAYAPSRMWSEVSGPRISIARDLDLAKRWEASVARGPDVTADVPSPSRGGRGRAPTSARGKARA